MLFRCLQPPFGGADRRFALLIALWHTSVNELGHPSAPRCAVPAAPTCSHSPEPPLPSSTGSIVRQIAN